MPSRLAWHDVAFLSRVTGTGPVTIVQRIAGATHLSEVGFRPNCAASLAEI
jgi:hypothetical protein